MKTDTCLFMTCARVLCVRCALFFNTLKSAFSHVGIYVGNNRFIHSPRSGGVVRIDSLDSEYWIKHFDGAKRIDANKENTKSNSSD